MLSLSRFLGNWHACIAAVLLLECSQGMGGQGHGQSQGQDQGDGSSRSSHHHLDGRPACDAARLLLQCSQETGGQAGPSRTGHHTRGEWRLPSLCDDENSRAPAGRALRPPPLPSGATFGQHYDVVLVVDSREQVRGSFYASLA